jgi:alpha-amylase/alpha-mannosidase (GH57 family)
MAKLIFGIHNHQPVDNFREIVEEAIKRAYEPFIRTAFEFKKFKFSIHFSGWLLEYIVDNK